MATRQAIREKIHDRLYAANITFRRLRNGPDASTLTEFTATTSITDTALREVAAFPNDFFGAWIRLMYFDNSGTPALQEIVSRIHQFAPETGKLTFSPTIGTVNGTAATVDGHYEIWPDIHPDAVDGFINDILNALIYEGFIPHTLVTDGDMEDSDLTNWTALTAGAPATTDAKATSPFKVGRQAIHGVAAAVDEGRRSARIPCTPGQQFNISVPVKVDVGSVDINFVDATASTNIKSTTVTDTAAVEVRYTAAAPADCKIVHIEYASNANLDDFYIGPISILKTDERRASVDSSTIDYADDIIGAYELPVGPTAIVSDTYLAFTEPWVQIDITKRDAERDALPITAEVLSSRPIYLKVHRRYPSLTADTATTAAHKLMVVNGALSYVEEARGNDRKAARYLRTYHELRESAGLSLQFAEEPDRQLVRFR
jgi:hypothetical protein